MNEIRARIEKLKEQKREIEREIKELEDNTIRVGEYVKLNKIIIDKERTKYKVRLTIFDSYGYFKNYAIISSVNDVNPIIDYINQVISDLTKLSDMLADMEDNKCTRKK